MTRVILKISRAGTYAEVLRLKLPFSSLEEGNVLVRSQLGEAAPLNDHLVWLWGMLKHERRILKSAAASGATITCECKVPKGHVRLLPNGAEMLHLLGAELNLEAK
jgi:hypothetical protein